MTDSYGRKINYLRLSVTDRCNLRCRYCMPEEGLCMKSHADMMTEEEMIMAVEAAAGLGVEKLRITGGEPLVKRNIISICRRCAEVEGISEICLTTNGILLPSMAEDLKKAGVSRVNISLDTLREDRYAHITRGGSLKAALEGIEAALSVGFDSVKVNAVLIGGFNDDEVYDLAMLSVKYPLDMRFIELMPMVDSEEFGQSAYIPGEAVLKTLPAMEALAADGSVARLYRIPGAKGRVGLISPVSNHFCGSCNRIRITADGKLKPCLHSSQEFSLKGMDREAMASEIQRAILVKPGCHDTLSAEKLSGSGRSMNRIGG